MKETPNGHVAEDMSNDEYHAHPALSRSKLWTFKELPYKYWYKYLSGLYSEPKETEALLMGQLSHTMILEPDFFSERYYVMEKVNRTTKAGKAAHEEALELSKGRILINSEQFAWADAMRDSVYKNKVANDILYMAKIEHSVFWADPISGLELKARPDIWNSPVWADLKTTLDAGYRGFQSTAYREGYFLQAAMCFEASKAIGEPFEKFVFMCVEKKAPYSTCLYMLDDEALQFGLDLLRKLQDEFKRCQDKDEWPDYGIQMLMIPRYATMELEHE